jgi:hypothetical protein
MLVGQALNAGSAAGLEKISQRPDQCVETIGRWVVAVQSWSSNAEKFPT